MRGVGGRKIAITSAQPGNPVEGVSATRRLIDLDKVDFISATYELGDARHAACGRGRRDCSSMRHPPIEDYLWREALPASNGRSATMPTREPSAGRPSSMPPRKRGFTKLRCPVVRLRTRSNRVHEEISPAFQSEIFMTEDYYKKARSIFAGVLAKIETPAPRPSSCTQMRTRRRSSGAR